MKTERDRPIERLADALQACFDESARNAAQQVKDELVPRLDKMDTRLDRQDEAIRKMGERMDTRLDRQDAVLEKQNATLKLFWGHMKGNGKLPIDEPLGD